jgi:integrase
VVPEHSIREKGYSAEHIQTVYAAVSNQLCRDVMRLQVTTGLHHSEAERVARGGEEARLTAVAGAGAIEGTITFGHKRGSPHTVSLDAAGLAAGRRLQERRRAPGQGSMYKQLRAASLRAGKEHVRAGELRHSFVTLGQGGRWVYPGGKGIGVYELAAVTGHRSPATTRRF